MEYFSLRTKKDLLRNSCFLDSEWDVLWCLWPQKENLGEGSISEFFGGCSEIVRGCYRCDDGLKLSWRGVARIRQGDKARKVESQDETRAKEKSKIKINNKWG